MNKPEKDKIIKSRESMKQIAVEFATYTSVFKDANIEVYSKLYDKFIKEKYGQ